MMPTGSVKGRPSQSGPWRWMLPPLPAMLSCMARRIGWMKKAVALRASTSISAVRPHDLGCCDQGFFAVFAEQAVEVFDRAA